jgi:hypothetical protein
MKVSIYGCKGPQMGLKEIIFSSFLGLLGPPGPIYTTVGGGLGVLIVTSSVGCHLVPFLLSWVHYSRIYGSYSDFGGIKVVIFF